MTYLADRESPLLAPPGQEEASAQQNANADLLAVGAVYDRAVFAVAWDERAVIDPAYSRKWAANFLLCKAPGGAMARSAKYVIATFQTFCRVLIAQLSEGSFGASLS